MVMDHDATFHDAKRLYLESYGDPMVTNTYLKIALVLVSLIAVALVLVDLRPGGPSRTFGPWSSASTTLGARKPSITKLEYKPHDAEAKYF